MSEHWRVLVTGPVRGLERWCAAAREAGWEAIPFPLVTIEETGVDPLPQDDPLPDWIAVTSANALPALKRALDARPDLRQVPLVCVGQATADQAAELGLPEPRLPAPGAQDAEGLATTLLTAAKAGQQVLWPRGDRAREFGERLAVGGLDVSAPTVYRTTLRTFEEEPPAVDAVFFASPSGVTAWRAAERRGVPAAIAIGWTTLEALQPVSEHFSMLLPLMNPSIPSFQDCLRSFFPSE